MLTRILLIIIIICFSPILYALDTDNTESRSNSGVHNEIPFKKEDTVPVTMLQNIAITMIFAILFALIIIVGLKKYFYGQNVPITNKRIQVLEMKRLTPKSTLFLVKIDNTKLVLGQSGENLILLEKEKYSENEENGIHNNLDSTLISNKSFFS